MKKITALLAVVLALSVLVSCGSKTAGNGTGYSQDKLLKMCGETQWITENEHYWDIYDGLDLGEEAQALNQTEKEELWSRLDGYWEGQNNKCIQFYMDGDTPVFYYSLVDEWKLYGTNEHRVTDVVLTSTGFYELKVTTPVEKYNEDDLLQKPVYWIRFDFKDGMLLLRGVDGFLENFYYPEPDVPEVVTKPVIEYPEGVYPDELPVYTAGTYTFSQDEYDIHENQRLYRYIYYTVPDEYKMFLPEEDLQDDYDLQVNVFSPNGYPAMYLDDPYYHPMDLPTQMCLKNFVAFYGISREEFDYATEKYAQRIGGSGSDSDEYEIPNGDIIYTFDDEIINEYYGRY